MLGELNTRVGNRSVNRIVAPFVEEIVDKNGIRLTGICAARDW